MSDEPFYTPGLKPPPPKPPKPREGLWQLRTGHVTWSCELLDHGAYGVEAQILRDGEFVIGRRFDTRALAVQWAELEREAMKGNP